MPDRPTFDRPGRGRLRAIASVTLIILFLAAALWYLWAHRDEIAELDDLRWPELAVVALLLVVNIGLRGFFTLQVLRPLDVHLRPREALCLAAVATMMNLLLPVGSGAAYRAFYLARVHQLTVSRFAATLAVFYLFMLFAATGLGLLATGWIFSTSIPVRPSVVAILLVLFASSALSIYAACRSAPWRRYLPGRLADVADGWQQISRSRRLTSTAILVVLVSSLTTAASFFFAFRAFGVPIDAPGGLLLMASQRVGDMINLTPGAVGFQELVGLYFGTMLQAKSAPLLVVLGAMRIVRILVAICLGLPSLMVLSRRTRT